MPTDDVLLDYSQHVDDRELQALDGEQTRPVQTAPSPAPVAASTGTPEQRQHIESEIQRVSRVYRLDPRLVRSVVQRESNFNPQAVSAKGAQGLMQLMPDTAKRLGVTDPFDISQNLDGGARYLHQQLQRYNGNVPLALAAYNAGHGAVDRYQGIPPYPATQHYVTAVTANVHVQAIEGMPGTLTEQAERLQPPAEPGADGRPQALGFSPAEQFMRTGVQETLRQTLGGVLAAAKNTTKAVEEVADFVGLLPPKGEATRLSELLPQIARSEQPIPEVARGIAQFLTVFIPASAAVVSLGIPAAVTAGATAIGAPAAVAGVVGTAVGGALAGIPADYLAFDPTQPNVSAALEHLTPDILRPVVEFLATDPQDAPALNRLRNAVEGVILGAFGDLVTHPRAVKEAFVSTVESMRQAGAGQLERVLPVVGRILSEERGSIRVPFRSRKQEARQAAASLPPDTETIRDTIAHESDPEIRDFMERAVDLADTMQHRIDVQRRAPGGSPRSQREVLAESRQLLESGTFSQQRLESMAPGSLLPDSEARAVLELVGERSTRLRQVALEVMDDPSPINRERFWRQFVLLQQADPVRFGLIAESGRALRVLGDPTVRINQFVDQFRRVLQDSPDFTENELIAQVVSLHSLEDFDKYLISPGRPTPVDDLMEQGGLTPAPAPDVPRVGPEPLQPRIIAQDELTQLSPDDFTQMLDDLGTAGAAAPTPPPSPRQRRQAAQRSARQETVSGVREALTGLSELFGGGRRLGAGLTFDEETYRAAKPHLQQAFAHFQALGQDLRTIVASLLEEFGDELRPYLQRFHADVQAGEADIPRISRGSAEREERGRRRARAAATPERQAQIAQARQGRQERRAALRAQSQAEQEAFEATPEGQLEMQLLEEEVRGQRMARRQTRGQAGRRDAQRDPETPDEAIETMLEEADILRARREAAEARALQRDVEDLAQPPRGETEAQAQARMQRVVRDEARRLARRRERTSPAGQARRAEARERVRQQRLARTPELVEGGVDVPGQTISPREEPFVRAGDDLISGPPDALPKARVARGGHPAVRGTQATQQFVSRTARMAEIGRLTYDIVQEAWINSRLIRPTTHTVAFLSNQFATLWAIPEQFVAAALPGGSMRDARAFTYGILEGYHDAFRMIGDGLWERYQTALETLERGGTLGEAVGTGLRERRSRFARQIEQLGVGLEPGSKIDAPLRQALSRQRFLDAGIRGNAWLQAADIAGELVRLPGRALGAADDFSKIVNYRGELRLQAMREASSEGLSGEGLTRRIQELTNHPQTERELAVHESAMQQSIARVFQAPLGPAASQFMNLRNRVPFAWLAFPFVRTGINEASYVAQRVPLAFAISRTFRDNLAAGGDRTRLATAQLALGSAAIGLALYWAALGRTSGKGAFSPGVNEALERQNIPQDSIQIGANHWAPLRLLGPYGTLLKLGTDFHEIYSHGDTFTVMEDGSVIETAPALWWAAFSAIKDSLVSRTWFDNLARLVDVFEEPYTQSPEEAQQRFEDKLTRFIGGAVTPPGVTQIERFVSPEEREATTFLERLRANIPMLSGSLPLHRNLYGQPTWMTGGLLYDSVSATYDGRPSGRAMTNAVDTEIVRLQVDIRHAPKSVRFPGTNTAVQLSTWEYDTFVQLSAGIFPWKDTQGTAYHDPAIREPQRVQELFKRQLPQAMQGKPLFAVLEAEIASPRYKALDTDSQRRTIVAIVHGYRQAAALALQAAYPAAEAIGGRVRQLQLNPPQQQTAPESLMRRLGVNAPSSGPPSQNTLDRAMENLGVGR